MNTQSAGAYPPGRLPANIPAVATGDTALAVPGRAGYPAFVAEPYPAAAEMRINLFDYWRILKKRRWIVLGVLGAVLTITLFSSLLTTPKYVSTATLQIDSQTVKIVDGENLAPSELREADFFQTQHELLRSRFLAQRVVAGLNLTEDRSFLIGPRPSLLDLVRDFLSRRSRDDTGANIADRQRAAVGIVMANTVVKPVRSSRLVRVSYTDPDPGRSQRIVNAIAESFVASNLDRRVDASAYAKTFLEDQLQQLKLRLEDSERALLAFAQKEKIVTIDEKSSLVESSLSAANSSLAKLSEERIRNEQVWRQTQGAIGNSVPQVLASKLIETLREKRVELGSDYKEKLGIFKPDYPIMVQLKKRIDELDRQIAAETKTIKESLKVAYETSKSQEGQVERQVEMLRREMLDLQQRSIQYNIFKREADTNRSMYDGMLQRYKEVGVAAGVGTNNISIVDSAEIPRSPASPRLTFNLALALLVGCVAGVLAALVTEFYDDTVKSPEDLERAGSTVILGIIPKIRKNAALPALLADPRSAPSEAYRSLCTALQFSTAGGVPKTLLVTSAGPSEGKSTTALALAKNFASMGLQVLLVDADLRNPSLHRAFKVDNGFGLSNYLAGRCEASETFRATPLPSLAFMASGPLPPNPAELLTGPRLQSLLELGVEEFDLVVMDGPPVLGLADTLLLASAAAGTVFVVSASQTRADPVRFALKRLGFARAHILGAALTKFDSRDVGYGYGHGDGAYDYYAYGSKPARISGSSAG